MSLATQKTWRIKSLPETHSLPAQVPPALVPVLLDRGIDSAEKLRLFFNPPYVLPHDPLRMSGMDRAVQRLYGAIQRQETVGVFGDFDVDGVTGTAIMVEGLRSFGLPVIPYLPHRSDEGHGLSQAAIEQLTGRGASLILTVDCGVTSIEEVAFSQQLGTEVIITDHHTPGPTLPEAVAIINPRVPGSPYPFQDLCGAGLAFKLIQGLCQFQGQPWSAGLLELAALGTIADLVPLVDENRYLVREGLKALTETRRPGLLALYRQGRIDGDYIDADTVSYQIAPRLNAAGRMGHAGVSLELLTTPSEQQAVALAAELEEFNLQRRDLSTSSYQAAVDQLEKEEGLPPILIVSHANFTPGVAGLVAGRLLESYNRPAIALASAAEGYLVASGRSTSTFNLVQALTECQDLLVRFGGHAQAAGFTIQESLLPKFTRRMTQLALDQLGNEAPDDASFIDAEVGLPSLNEEALAWMADMEPWGVENPSPVFYSKGVHVMEARYIGNQGQHIRMRVRQGDSEWTALAFNQSEKWVEGAPYLDLVFTITRDSWRGVVRHNLRLLDFWPSR